MAEGSDNGGQSKCGICLSCYTEPRLLTCYHAFCTACLETLTSVTNNAECPLCRTKIFLSQEEIKGLKVYPVNESFIKAEGKELEVCDLCFDEKRAVARCCDCEVQLCFKCREYHSQLKTSRNHKTEQINIAVKVKPFCETLSEACSEHKKTLEVFCIPCNKLICNECHDNKHAKHKTETKDAFELMKRDMLLAKNASLKRRITIFENVLEQAKLEENSYYKLSNQVKREIQSYAVGLKEVFCRAVDYLTKEQKNIIDKTRKTDIKIIQTYQEELETEIISLQQFTENVDNIIKTSTDQECLHEAFKLEKKLDQNLEKSGTSMPVINVINFEYGNFTDDRIQELFGKIKINASTKDIKPSFQHLPLPIAKTELSKINGFKSPNRVLGMVPANNNNIWILTGNSLNLYNSDGSIQESCKSPVNCKSLLQKSVDDIWVWCGDHAVNMVKRDNNIKQYKVSFKNTKVGCFIHTGNLVVYNPTDKHLYEVTETDTVKKLCTGEQLQKILDDKEIVMKETKKFDLVITQMGSKLFIVHKNGSIINIFHPNKQLHGVEFKAITTDNYGNIIAADYQNDSLVILSKDGVLLRNVTNLGRQDLYGVRFVAVDGCGNLWFSNHHDNIFVYSYI